MTNPRHALGAAAERAVDSWLSGCGWLIVARRVRSSTGGEVDLVALDPSGTLVAVEVRARHTTRSGSAGHSVDARRVQRLRRTLVAAAAASSWSHRALRVDLVTVEPDVEPERWRLTRLPGIG